MSATDFFNRWSKRKASWREEEAAADPAAPEAMPAGPSVPAEPPPPPTLEDVERLTPQSDFSAFVAKGVDEDVRRSAFKKLFADPHFNRMDGLDIYIDDYTKPDPIPPAMLAALEHAKDLLDPLGTAERRSMALLDAGAGEPGAADEGVPAASQQDAAADTVPATDVHAQEAQDDTARDGTRDTARDASPDGVGTAPHHEHAGDGASGPEPAAAAPGPDEEPHEH